MLPGRRPLLLCALGAALCLLAVPGSAADKAKKKKKAKPRAEAVESKYLVKGAAEGGTYRFTQDGVPVEDEAKPARKEKAVKPAKKAKKAGKGKKGSKASVKGESEPEESKYISKAEEGPGAYHFNEEGQPVDASSEPKSGKKHGGKESGASADDGPADFSDSSAPREKKKLVLKRFGDDKSAGPGGDSNAAAAAAGGLPPGGLPPGMSGMIPPGTLPPGMGGQPQGQGKRKK